MDLLQTLRILNLATALLSVAPSFYLLQNIIKERPLIKTEHRLVNSVLTLVGAGTALAGVLNGVTLLAIMLIDGGWSTTVNGLSVINMKNLIVNIVILLISSSLAYLVYRHGKDRKN